jgi:hypothetical protein
VLGVDIEKMIKEEADFIHIHIFSNLQEEGAQ